MTHTRVKEILTRIVPWLSDAAELKQKANYKGVRGRIGIVGGARDYAGAPFFASMSALHLGADLAYVICTKGSAPAIKGYSPDLIVTPILDANNGQFEFEIQCLLARLHALVVGPGLGREASLQARAKRIIELAKSRSLPIILDADSLLIVNEDPSIIKSCPNVILTPNRIELQRLLNTLYAPQEYDLGTKTRQEIELLTRKCSVDLDVTILAKGKIDIICNKSASFATDEDSGTDRRCGGQGDITSGLAGVYYHWIRLASERLQPNEAPLQNPAAWAAYLSALTTKRCNELAVMEHGQGTLASDMLRKVQPALNSLLGGLLSKAQSASLFRYTGTMSQDEIKRYARQMIMDEFGPARQLQLRKASAVIIGAGGLGCPSSIYLAAAGIGRIGIVDDDKVEVSNLHRQILHNVHRVGILKTESIKESILDVNPNVKVETHSVRLDRYNAVGLIEDYDIVIDATDNLLTRYIISDACVVAKKPLVSGAALKMDGQLTVYNYDDLTPCFRCLFPDPPQAVGSCSENGVLGVLPGIIGVHQALEAIKIAAGLRPSYAGKMLIFDGQLGLNRHVTLSVRKPDCPSCGKNSNLGRDLIDYDEFCRGTSCSQQKSEVNILEPVDRITVEQYRDLLLAGMPHVLVDVRPEIHSQISKFEHAVAIPVAKLMQEPEESFRRMKDELDAKETRLIFVVCRKGIASQRGTKIIRELFEGLPVRSGDVEVKDIIGGMTAWSSRIDASYSCL